MGIESRSDGTDAVRRSQQRLETRANALGCGMDEGAGAILGGDQFRTAAGVAGEERDPALEALVHDVR